MKKLTITAPTLAETLASTPNPRIVQLRSRRGGGTHKTRKGDNRRDRRQARQECRRGGE